MHAGAGYIGAHYISNMKKENFTLVTGATAGFGKAIARQLASEGHKIIITGRREERLERIRQELLSRGCEEVLTLSFDVRDRQAVKEAAGEMAEKGVEIGRLVNNAGLALGLAGIEDGDPDDWETMIDTNVKGLLFCTKYFLPLMPDGAHILHIGSIAGKEVYPGGNVYSATKHAVDALNRAMRIDLLERGIKVSQIAPGLAETEFSIVRFKGDNKKAAQVYRGLTPLFAGDIAEAASFIFSRPEHVCINDMVIMASAQASSTHVRRSQ